MTNKISSSRKVKRKFNGRKKKHNDFTKKQKDNISARLKENNKHPVSLAFNKFAKKISDIVGSAYSFILALAIVFIWAVSGKFFNYSDTWQLVINTGTTIVTFLVVFLIQNTQNRDTEIINLKIDELILAKKGARNQVIDLNELSDVELRELEKEYIRLCNKRTGK